jgi:hypothetical protein
VFDVLCRVPVHWRRHWLLNFGNRHKIWVFDHDQLVSNKRVWMLVNFMILKKSRLPFHFETDFLVPSVTMDWKHEMNRNWHHLVASRKIPVYGPAADLSQYTQIARISHLSVKVLRARQT